MTYVTSSPIAPTIVDYYLSLLTRRMRRLARSRLTLIALADRTTRPLSQKLLERACVLDVIRRTIPEPRLCHLVPYNTTQLERDLALALDIPIEGADPRHAHFGTKSGCRELFAQAGIPHPLGIEHITSIGGAIHAITRLRATKPDITDLVMNLIRAPRARETRSSTSPASPNQARPTKRSASGSALQHSPPRRPP